MAVIVSKGSSSLLVMTTSGFLKNMASGLAVSQHEITALLAVSKAPAVVGA